VSTKNLSGHDLPYRTSVEQGDFASRLLNAAQKVEHGGPPVLVNLVIEGVRPR